MSDKSIFVFGSKIFEEQPKRDAITSLPLEMAWKIFSYLDDQALQMAYHTSKTWSRIITANKKLMKRLNIFELAIRLGSKALAKFHRRNMRIMKKETKKNYIYHNEICHRNMNDVEERDYPTNYEIAQGSKRRGENMVFQVKRYKLF